MIGLQRVRVFLDENMPRPLRGMLDDHEVSFVEKEGWKGRRNGELLSLVEASFDVLVTSDGNMEFQNELVGRSLSLIVFPTNNLKLLRANALAVRTALDEVAALGFPVVMVLDWTGARRMRRLVAGSRQEVDLPAVPPFGTRDRPTI